MAPPLAATASDAAASPPAAFWALRHSESAITVAVDLGGERRIEVGPSGERWLVSSGNRTVAASFFPERVTHALRVGDDIVFVTGAGTTYPVSASDPLGPIRDPSRPPHRLARVATGKSSIVGIDGRDVIRSGDGGRTWSKVHLDGAPPRVPGSIAMSPEGVGAMVAFPQRSFGTIDDGLHWSPLAPPLGGIAEVTTAGLGIFASSEGPFDSKLVSSPLRWEPGTAGAPSGADAAPEPELAYDGAFAGRRWLEVEPVPGGSEPVLWADDLAEQSAVRQVQALPMCAPDAKVGASPDGRIVVVACASPSSKSELIVLRSLDGGTTLRREATLRAGGDGTIRVTVAEDGTTAIVGASTSIAASPPGAVIGAAGGYRDVMTMDGTRAVPIDQIAFASSSIVAMGGEDDGSISSMVAFVSDDGGRTWQVTRRFPSVTSIDALSAEEDDVTAQGLGPLLLSGDGGRTWRSVDPPSGAVELSMSGRHGLAVTPHGLLETTDGARTWSAVARPMLATDAKLHCGPEGCIVTDWARRIGWSAPGETATALPVESPAAPSAATPPSPRLRCRPAGPEDRGYHAAWAPLLNAEPGLRWTHVVARYKEETGRGGRGAGTLSLVEQRATARGLAREVHPLLEVAGGRGDQVDPRLTPDGVSVLEYPGADYMEAITYTGAGPLHVAWVSNRDPATVRHASFDPHVRGGPAQSRVLDDGSVLVNVGASAFVLGPDGVRKSIETTEAWNVAHAGGRTLLVDGNLRFRDLGSPGKTVAWTLDQKEPGDWAAVCLGGCGPELDATHGVSLLDGRLVAWTTRPDVVLLARVSGDEPEPTAVSAIDMAPLFASAKLAGCPARRRGVRAVVAPPAGIRVAVDLGRAAPLDLEVKRAVVDAALDGSGCVRALFASEPSNAAGDAYSPGIKAAIFPDDLAHATLFSVFGRDDYDRPLSCGWEN